MPSPDPLASPAVLSGPRGVVAEPDARPWEVAFFDLVHPLQVAIVEAQLWADEPLSATELVKVFDGRFGLNTVSYHVRRLARRGVLTEVSNRQIRGAVERFYRLRDFDCPPDLPLREVPEIRSAPHGEGPGPYDITRSK